MTRPPEAPSGCFRESLAAEDKAQAPGGGARSLVFVNRFFYPDHSATSQLLSDLAFFLAARGYRVCVITSRQGYEDPRAQWPARESLRGVTVYRVWTSRCGRDFLPGRALDYLTFYASIGWRLLRLLGPGDVVVAKTDPPLLSVVAGWAARARRATLVNWLQDLFPEVATALGVGTFANRWMAFLARQRDRSLRQAVCNVAIGEGMRARLRARGLETEPVCVIANWADETRIRPQPAATNPLRREWGLAECFVLGYSGNLGRAHESATLLAAAEALRDREDIRWLFVGGGATMARLRAEAAERGLGNLLFRPYQPLARLGLSLGVADVHLVILRPELEGLIVPSKFYGIAAAGRPMLFLGHPRGEIARLLTEHGAGLSVAIGDGPGLAATVLRLRGDPRARAQLGRQARQLSVARFSRQAALARWEAVCAAALRAPGA